MGRRLHAPLRTGARRFCHAAAAAQAQWRVVSGFPAELTMSKAGVILRLGAAGACAGVLALFAPAAPAAAAAPAGGGWGKLLPGWSGEKKVAKTTKPDRGEFPPADLRRYPLGSILAGGNSGPGGNDRAPAEDWVRLAREFHAVSLEARAGHEPIPLLFGIDAVHGHNNIVGAVLYPHNIGLGAAHDPGLVRRIGAATAEAVAAPGIDRTFP